MPGARSTVFGPPAFFFSEWGMTEETTASSGTVGGWASLFSPVHTATWCLFLSCRTIYFLIWLWSPLLCNSCPLFPFTHNCPQVCFPPAHHNHASILMFCFVPCQIPMDTCWSLPPDDFHGYVLVRPPACFLLNGLGCFVSWTCWTRMDFDLCYLLNGLGCFVIWTCLLRELSRVYLHFGW